MTLNENTREILGHREEHFGHGKFTDMNKSTKDALKRMKLRAVTDLNAELSTIFEEEFFFLVAIRR